jgi:hypothetical protein
MKTLRATIIICFIMGVCFSSLFFSSCKDKSVEGNIILTLINSKEQKSNYLNGNSWRNDTRSQIASLDPDITGMELKVLTSGYYSAFSPAISDDGRFMLFAGKQKQNDPWQIYEMNLGNSEIRQVITSPENNIYPVYLPNGRIAFSRTVVNKTPESGQSLYTCNPDGSDIRRITFNDNAFFASTMLKDGRILTFSQELQPSKRDPAVFVLRPDGTKAGLFYKGNDGCAFSGRGWETINGRIVFIESVKNNQNSRSIISINYNRPLHSAVNLTSEIKGDFNTVSPVNSGKLLVTCRQSEGDRYSVYEFDPEKRTLGRVIYSSTEYDVIDALIIEKHQKPRKLPSEVDMGVKTGLLLCQDINQLYQTTEVNTSASPKAAAIRVIGRDSTLGVVKVEEDGSFYLKIIADTPFQIQSIDEKGNVLNGPCEWIWLRPNERRGCVGCHEDPELVPSNRIPFSVKKSPVNVPVHINKVVEKKVSLE